MSTDQPGTGQPSWRPSPYGQPATGPYGQPPAAPPPPAYGRPPADGQGFPVAPAYAGYGAPAAYAGPELAHWGLRVGASMVDGLVMNIPLGIGYAVFLGGIGVDAAGNARTPSGSAALLLFLGSLLSLGLWIWNRGVQQGGTGQSVGKRMLGIRLLREDTGRPMGAGMALARDLVHIVDGVFYLGYLWPLWDPKKQTFADKLLTTVVVKG